MKSNKREQKLEEGFGYEGFEFKEVYYPAITVKGLLILKGVNSPFYENTSNAWVETALDYAFVTSQSKEAINKAKVSEEIWRETIMEYADTFTMIEMVALHKKVDEASSYIYNALVELREDDGDTEKK